MQESRDLAGSAQSKRSKRLERIFGAFVATAMLGACDSAHAPDVNVTAAGSQCGPTWDLQNVEQYDGTLGVTADFVDLHQGPVGYHVRPGCSGTLISTDLFISAGHCGYRVGDSVRFNYQYDASGSARPTTTVSVTEVVEQVYGGGSGIDYAIVRLSGSPGSTFGFAQLFATNPPVNELLTIIGHPARVPKALHTGVLYSYSSSLGSNYFRHRVDTTGGSSGSGVLDADGRLIGVHTNAGCSTSGTTSGNSAVRMSSIVAQSAALQALDSCSFTLSAAEAIGSDLVLDYSNTCSGSGFSLYVDGVLAGTFTGLGTGTTQVTVSPSTAIAAGSRIYVAPASRASVASNVVVSTVGAAPDAGTPDLGTPDSGTPDLGTPDTGVVTDAGTSGPALVTPAAGSTLPGSTATFTWTAGGASIQQWFFEVGTASGTDDIYSGVSLGSGVTSHTATGLPTDGSTVWVTLSGWNGSEWIVIYQSYGTGSGGSSDAGVLDLGPADTGVTPDPGTPDSGVVADAGTSGPALVSPSVGSTLPGSSATFTWTAGGSAVSQYYFEVGSAAGTDDIYSGVSLGSGVSSHTATGLPTDGRTVYVTLSAFVGTEWVVVYADYVTSGGTGADAGVTVDSGVAADAGVGGDAGTGTGTPALLSPTPGSTISGGSATFTWTAGAVAVDQWYFEVGNAAGTDDLYTGVLLGSGVSSHTATGLPTSGTVWVTLSYYAAGEWNVVYESYSTAP